MGKNKHVHHDQFHLVMSPKECPDPTILHKWLQKKERHGEQIEYVIAYERGENQHLHLDCYMKFDTQKRQDLLLRDILNLYGTLIPSSEIINITLTINKLDPNPLWGFGYSLKEGLENWSNLTIDHQEQALKYFKDNYQRVMKLKSEVMSLIEDNKPYSLDRVFKGLVGYATAYLTKKTHVDKYEDISHHFLIDEYICTLFNCNKISFTTYQKINKEKMREAMSLRMRAPLLTSPIPQKTTINTSQNNPLISENLP